MLGVLLLLDVVDGVASVFVALFVSFVVVFLEDALEAHFLVDGLGDLDLVQDDRCAVRLDFILGVFNLLLFVLEPLLFLVGEFVVLFEALELSGLSNVSDLPLSEDDLTPVHKGVTQLFQSLHSCLEAAFSEWWRNLESGELFDHFEVNLP